MIVRFGVCSAGRPQGCADKTVATLLRGGVPGSSITVYVPNTAEAGEYRIALPEGIAVQVVPHDPTDKSLPRPSARAAGLATARYLAAEHQSALAPRADWVWWVDDDVDGYVRLVDRRARPVENVHKLLCAMAAAGSEVGATLVGIAPSPNPLSMGSDCTFGLSFCIGQTYATARHLPTWLCEKEDYERSIAHYLLGGGALRFNGVAALSKVYAGAGGLQLSRTFERSHAEAAWLVTRHPTLIRLNPRRTKPVAEGRAELLVRRQANNVKVPDCWTV